MKDLEILRWAHEFENHPNIIKSLRHWERPPGSTSEDIRRLRDGGYIEVTTQSSGRTWYKLTQQGEDLLFTQNLEREMSKIPADTIKDAMATIIGFDEVKDHLSWVIEKREKIHTLLVGPPACAKSLFLEAIRSAVPEATTVFGSQTSASGLSDILFDVQPQFLLADELDKMRYDAYSIMLALLERGEILVTKSQNTRGIQLDTIVFAACNSTKKMPPELIPPFVPLYFTRYSKEEFIKVCCGFLSRSENCTPELGELIGQQVYDYDLGDVRIVRKIYRLLKAPTEAEVHRVINFIRKYGQNNSTVPERKTRTGNRLPGM